MITVLRASGLSIAIYRHDHEPPHIHVIGDGTAKILLAGSDGLLVVIEVRGLKYGDMRKALQAVSEHQGMLIELWRDIHG